MTQAPENKRRLPRVDLPADARIDTLAVREGLPPSAWGENSEALFLTSSFVHPDAATAAARFANEEEAFVYSRFTNPTVMMMERRLAALEGAEACIATSSGMSAITLMLLSLLKAGDHLICSRGVFGSTIKLLQAEFAKFGVETSFVSQTDVNEWRSAVRSNTHACCLRKRRAIRSPRCATSGRWPRSRMPPGLCSRSTTAFVRQHCSGRSRWAPTW